MAFFVPRNAIILLLLIHVCFEGVTSKPAKAGKAEAIITKKLKGANPATLNKYKMIAAKRMQVDVGKALKSISTSETATEEVKNFAKMLGSGLRSGKLTPALASSMPTILQQGSIQQGKPAEQLQTILGNVISQPNAPLDFKNPLQGTLNFVAGNLSGVNNLLGKVSGGVSDLLSGTVSSLGGSLGAVTDSINGSAASLGPLMGGLLSG